MHHRLGSDRPLAPHRAGRRHFHGIMMPDGRGGWGRSATKIWGRNLRALVPPPAWKTRLPFPLIIAYCMSGKRVRSQEVKCFQGATPRATYEGSFCVHACLRDFVCYVHVCARWRALGGRRKEKKIILFPTGRRRREKKETGRRVEWRRFGIAVTVSVSFFPALNDGKSSLLPPSSLLPTYASSFFPPIFKDTN